MIITMKNNLFSIIALCLICAVFVSCEKDKNTGAGGRPTSVLTIVKFGNADQTNKVVVQHPIKNWDGTVGEYVYLEDVGLYLHIIPQDLQGTVGVGAGMGHKIISWADSVANITSTSPYLPLIGGYYLVDWKWHQLCPLSAIAEVWNQPSRNYLAEHLLEHCFWTDIDWRDLKDLETRFNPSIYTHNVDNVEIIRVDVSALAHMYQRDADPFVYYNYSIYSFDGMCWENAYTYYMNQNDYDIQQTYHDYIDFCDSLQVVYQGRLIELINNGKLKDVEYNVL